MDAWPNRATGKSVPPSDIVVIPDNVSSTQALVYLINYRLAYFLIQISARVREGAGDPVFMGLPAAWAQC